MSDTKDSPKHSTGKGAQAEHHNTSDEKSYVENPKEEKEDKAEEGDYLENKWKQISDDFKKTYKMDVSDSEYKGESFSDTLKNLETKTGKSRAKLEEEIRNWRHKK